ncbi:MAG: MFS transporter [Halobaculum sp.]
MVTLRALFGSDADVLGDRDFQLLLLASLSSPLGASVVSPIITSLAGPFGVTATRAGLLLSAFTLPAVVAIPLVGVAADRFGRKPVLATGLAVFGCAGLAVPLTADFRVALVLRAVQGVGYTGIGPILITATGDLFTGEREATAQGLRFTAVGASLTVFPLVSGALVAFAWQFPFVLYAVALPTALAVWLGFSEPTDADGDRGGDPLALLARATDRTVLATLLGRAVPTFLWFVFLTYNSIVIVTGLGGSPSAAGTLVAVASVASAVATTQVGRFTARFGRRLPTFVGVALAAGGLAVVAVAPSVLAALGGGALVGAGFSVAITLYRSAITSLTDERLRGGLVSLGESVGRVGSTAAPVVTGAAVAALKPAGVPAGEGTAVRTTLVATALGCVVLAGLLLLVGGSATDTTSDPTPADD